MTAFFRRLGEFSHRAAFAAAVLLLATAVARPACAAVELRVEARPISDPIQAFVTVTDGSGVPVEGLGAANFTLTIDGTNVPLDAGDITLPPAEDANQKVSVVFAMDYSQSVQTVALAAMQQAVIDFAGTMADGDQVAIIKFNSDSGASVVLPFTTIDHAGGSDAFIANKVAEPYGGDGTNLLDALELAVNQFIMAAPLPAGPKAIILISDGGENDSAVSESDVVALANANSIPIFTIGVGDLDLPGRTNLMQGLGDDTGGAYFPTASDEEIAAAYATISLRLSHEYLITIPSGIADCGEHEMEVTVAGQGAPASVLFTRRTCDTEPSPFSFDAQTNVARGATVTSNTVTITGIEVPAHISVISGLYSIGCNGTFTRDPGTIADGQTVCVRQNASDAPSTSKNTTLTVGGVAGVFTTTTRSGGGGGGGGGGGSTGLPELLLLGFGALLLRSRRPA